MMIKSTTARAILLMFLCTLFSSTAQILLKFAANQLDYTLVTSYFYWPLWLGFFSLAVGAVLMMAAFKSGELSILFPILSTSYVWVSLLSPLFFAEDSMNSLKWIGVIIILVSISLLGLASTGPKREDAMKTRDEGLVKVHG